MVKCGLSVSSQDSSLVQAKMSEDFLTDVHFQETVVAIPSHCLHNNIDCKLQTGHH